MALSIKWRPEVTPARGEFYYQSNHYKIHGRSASDGSEKRWDLYCMGNLRLRSWPENQTPEYWKVGAFESLKDVEDYLVHERHYAWNSGPQAGDIVRFAPGLWYTFKDDKGNEREGFGRIEHIDKDFFNGPSAHVCAHMGSAFGNHNAKALSISGGPFRHVKLEELKKTSEYKAARMWNWGLNSPGGDQGVEFEKWVRVWDFTPIKENDDV